MHLANLNWANASWLHWLLGVPRSDIPPDAVSQLVFRNAPESWRVFVLIGGCLALAGIVAYLYRRELDTCPRWAKVLLAGLRLAVVLLLVVIYLDPAVYFTRRRTLEPSIVLLRDASQSMASTEDRYLDDDSARIVATATGRSLEEVRSQRPTRAALVNEVLARDHQRLLRQLARQGTLRVVDFSNVITQVPFQRLEPPKSPPSRTALDASQPDRRQPSAAPSPRAFDLPPLKATGAGTDLCRAIQEGLSDRLLAAIVLFTDGQHTVKETGQNELRQAAEQARQRRVPLLIVGVGDPAKPRNLSVTDVYADPQVWQEDPFEVQATLRAQGIADESVDVSLLERALGENGAAEGAEKVVARRSVLIPAGVSQIRVAFTHSSPTPGRFAYTVRAALLPNESNEKDNESDTPAEVKVLGDRARVLLISGEPTWEYLLLLRLLMREKSIDVSSWLQTMDLDRDQEGKTVIRRLPRTREELFQYDVVMLLDPNPEEFDEPWLDLLKQFVGSHAGGVLYMAGPKYSGQFLAENRTRLMRDLLPVKLGDVGRLEVEQLLETNSRPWKLRPVPANADQPIMRFYPEVARSVARWQQLPGVYWSFPCDEAKPGARVLIEGDDLASSQAHGARPLLVTGMYGSGRSVYVGFNGTWRWRRMPNNAEFYQRFWLQTTRFLIEGRSVGGKRRGEIDTDQTRYTIGDRIAITARLKTPALEPLQMPRATATLETPGSPPEPIDLMPVASNPGQYAATLVARKTGHYKLSLTVPGEATSTPRETTASYSVMLPAVELEKPWLDKPRLLELANVSRGRYFELNEVDQLAAAVPDRRQVISVVSNPVLVRDSSRLPLLLLLVALLSLEWALRKHYKLI